MSIRAYRANIECEKEPSFNVWHDEDLVDFLSFYLPSEDGGLVSVDVEDLKKAIKKFKIKNEVLNKDLKWAKENNIEFIQYYCY